MLISSQRELEEAIKNGEMLLEITDRDAFRIGGDFAGKVRMVDVGHLCFEVYDKAAPEFVLEGWCVAIFDVRGTARPLIQAAENSTASVEARERSMPRLELYGSSHGRMDCYGESSPRVEIGATACLHSRVHGESAFLRIDARERSKIDHQGRGEIWAGSGSDVSITCDGRATVFGGIRIIRRPIVDLT